jgi:single-stranded DNA-binding protein
MNAWLNAEWNEIGTIFKPGRLVIMRSRTQTREIKARKGRQKKSLYAGYIPFNH